MRFEWRQARHVGWMVLTVLAGCSSYERPAPAPLQALSPEIAGRQVWSASLGDKVSFPMTVVLRQGTFVAAADDGTVVALEAASGKVVWRTRLKDDLSAGVGSDGRFAAVVTRRNQLVVMEKGAERWRATLDAKVLTAPLVAGERVFVVGVDRAIHAFDALDGRELWTLRRPGDALTLAQAAVMLPYKDTLVAGQGSRLVGIDPLKGMVRWEVPVATPRGTNEVERLADLVGPATRVSNVVCVRAFQSAVGCVDLDRGALQWSGNGGGLEAVAADADQVYLADASDRISAKRRTDGAVVWNSDRFLNRQLSAPALAGPAVVFGDLQGWVHFLAKGTGKPLLRLPTDGSPVVGAPTVAEDATMLVVTRKGGLFAFRPE